MASAGANANAPDRRICILCFRGPMHGTAGSANPSLKHLQVDIEVRERLVLCGGRCIPKGFEFRHLCHCATPTLDKMSLDVAQRITQRRIGERPSGQRDKRFGSCAAHARLAAPEHSGAMTGLLARTSAIWRTSTSL